MKVRKTAWAIMVVGALVAGSSVFAEAADGRRGGAHRGGSGWHAGNPRGNGGSHVGRPRGSGRSHVGISPRGSAWHSGSHRHGGNIHSGVGRWHGGTRIFIGGGLGWWGPGWYGAPYPYYVAPPVVVQPPPAEYIPAPAPPAQDYWYYCQSAGAYYPYVKECPGGWMQVVPQPAPQGQ